ncbi:hypothetical protein [Sphingobium lignivorans]|uniref:Cbb3-type cytochrome oxidase subunit 3 n=1 Tax=Sphingobium lignivorans TaxID=2735886 RepID=A0ABR6NFD4_9SPHN|nr:hypothetical protein [Sphingobium lignivorans]MBB5985998.1 cbb3-type cytochrome oxidase subunit 3 [Sphingobium lignivorans]
MNHIAHLIGAATISLIAIAVIIHATRAHWRKAVKALRSLDMEGFGK